MFTLTISEVGVAERHTTTYATAQEATNALLDFAGSSINIKTAVANGPTYYSGTIGSRAATDKIFQASHVWDIRQVT